MKREPVLVIVGAIGVLAQAAVALVVAFGVTLTQGQTAAVLGFVGAVLTLLLAVVTRGQVTPAAPLPGVVDQLAAVAQTIADVAQTAHAAVTMLAGRPASPAPPVPEPPAPVAAPVMPPQTTGP